MDINEFIISLTGKNVFLKYSIEFGLQIFGVSNLDDVTLNTIKKNKQRIINYLINSNLSDQDIIRIEESESYALSSSQRRLWVLSKFEGAIEAYNIPQVVRLEGVLNEQAFLTAYESLLTRHEVLRTIFTEDTEGNPRQRLLPIRDERFKIRIEDYSHYSQEDKNIKIKEYVSEEISKGFSLEEGPLIRCSLLKETESSYVWVLVMHHIVSDGWSMGVLHKDWSELYNAALEQRTPELAPLGIQYKDYAAWHNGQLESEEITAHKDYWLDQFKGELSVLELPSDKPRPKVMTYNGASLYRELDKETTERLKAFSQDQGGTLFMTMQTALNILLHKYTGQEDIVIGSPIAGREHPDLEGQIGFYVNTLALRNQFSKEDTITTLYQKIKQNTLGAYSHQVYPYDELVDALKLTRDMSRNPLFDVMLVLQNLEDDIENIDFLEVKIEEYFTDENITAKLDLSFYVIEKNSVLKVVLNYNSDVYTSDFCNSLLNSFIQTFEVLSLKDKLSNITILSEEEQSQLIRISQPSISNQEEITYLSMWDSMLAKQKNKTALIYKEKSYSFLELDVLSNQLAHYLITNFNIQPDDLVGIELERSEWMVIGILGIIKSGGAYVPIDPEYPKQRKAFIHQDSGMLFCLDQQIIDNFKNEVVIPSMDRPDVFVTPNQLIYTTYTSGSTGIPKGVTIENRQLSSFLLLNKELFFSNIDEGVHSNWFAVTNYTFDISVFELLGSLAYGFTLNLIPSGNTEYLLHSISNSSNGILQITPSYFEQLISSKNAIDILNRLHTILIGGELMSENVFSFVKKYLSEVHVFNVYGPTEATIWSTFFKLNNADKVQLGSPLVNESVFLFNSELNLVPYGSIGEICIGGVGLARGYLNRPELTKEKFIANPYKPGERLYRTGDLGRWREDGNLEYLGRIDDQVKIRGYRIELGEIEQAISTHPHSSQAVVIARAISKTIDKELIAYTTGEATAEELKAYLKERLPSYMVPNYYVKLGKIPLTSNGKVDRKGLPDPEGTGMQQATYIAPYTDTEKKLVKIWTEVLGVSADTLSIKADFFDLGGHSIKAIRLLGQTHKQLGVKIALKELFTHPTIEQLGKLISTSTEKEEYASIPTIKVSDDYAVSSSQRRLWVLSKFEGANEAYNIPQVVRLEGILNEQAFITAYESLLTRHEVLRTVFTEDTEGNPRQRVLPIRDERFKLRIEDYSHYTKEEKDSKLKEYVSEEISRGFSLEEGALIRGSLLKETESSYVWVLVMHHIVSDGWSMGVLHKEFSELYNAELENRPANLPALSIQYKDYSAWHNAQLQSEEINMHKDYWLEQFKGELPVLELPSDNARPKVMTYNGSSLYRELDKETTESLKAFSQDQGGTLFMTMQTALNILLHKYTGQEDIVIGSPIAGREHPDLEGQIGFYLGALPIRTTFSKEETVADVYQKIRQNTLDAYNHQVYPFDELVDALKLTRDTSRNPLFDVWLDYHSQHIESEGVSFKQIQEKDFFLSIEDNQTKFDLTFIFSDLENGNLSIYCEFKNDIISEAYFVNLLDHFTYLLQNIQIYKDYKICAVEILKIEEINDLIQFNDLKNIDDADVNTILDLFEVQAEKTPDAVAIKTMDAELSYRELNEKSNQLANYLIANYHIQPDDLVGIELGRSEWMVIGILAIIKSGGAYVPIDPNYPEQRKRNIYSQISINIQLDQDFLDEFLMVRYLYESINPNLNICPDSLVYCMFTSGSTGNPKGVLIEHKMLLNSTLARTSVYEDMQKKGLMLYSFSFDSSVNLTFRLLTSGGSLFIYESNQLDLAELSAIIQKENIDTLTIPPSVYDSLLSYEGLSCLRCVIVAGEECKPKVLTKHFEYLSETKLFNEYGPTECVVWCTYKLFSSPSDKVTIGKPVPSYHIYLLEVKGVKLVHKGGIGEICVGGISVGRGYLNDDELTREKFIDNPYKPGERLYRTGDLGRWDSNFELEYLGRIDNQVKIRGYRVELKEIEHAILQSQDNEEAVVMFSKKQFEDGRLIAYVKSDLEDHGLIGELKKNLPDYMVPDHIVWIKEIPLTAHLKVDYEKLPNPEGDFDKEFVRPRNKLEEEIYEIWKEALGFNSGNISIEDHFFQLGGNSIRAIRLLALVYKKFGVKIEISFLFEQGTIESIAQYLDNQNIMLIDSGYIEIEI